MTYVKITPKMNAKDLKALPELAATLTRLTDEEGKRQDAAWAAMPANLTAGQKRELRRQATRNQKIGRDIAARMRESAKLYRKVAARGKLTAAGRRNLRIGLGNHGTFEFVKL